MTSSRSTKAKRKSEVLEFADNLAKGAIQEATSQNPNVMRFFNSTPASMSQTKPKRRRPDEEHALSADEDDDKENTTPKHRVTCPTSPPSDTDIQIDDEEDSEEEASFDFIVSPHVLRPAAPPTRSTRPGKSLPEEYTELPPFSISSKRAYTGLVIELATALKCSVLDISDDKLSWKKKVPANSPKSLVGREVGWADILKQLRAAKPDKCGIIIFCPKPQRNLPEEEYDTEFAVPDMATNSIAEQQATFDQAYNGHMEQLQAAYPVGSHPLFPEKRIYQEKSSGKCWELTPLRLRAWASALGRQAATLETPPSSAHFNVSGCIKAMPRTPAVSEAPAPTATHPIATSLPTLAPASTGLFGSSIGIGELVALSMMSNMFGPGVAGNVMATAFPGLAAPANAPTNVSQAAPPTACDPTTTPSLPPSPHVNLNVEVPLEQFCNHYKLSSAIQAGLVKLGYTPGDPNLHKTETSDWRDYAGIPPLSWKRVLKVHQQFITDAREGIWDEFLLSRV
ncbi:hypothetical protein K435DRAFT_860920 [Dendrothele bispora CBS 962.96]|uniref:Uncharacterized protein n=1 Tax=Dendrothele bispora (strain CBS 962.96) TaxID=1314807 RepID=A0A4S8LWM0_DENBC|nr:hypothetical protein K435DRAFT_860920 [Dendrothele bispora CBS 962.96]